jgi:hypothetical protein
MHEFALFRISIEHSLFYIYNISYREDLMTINWLYYQFGLLHSTNKSIGSGIQLCTTSFVLAIRFIILFILYHSKVLQYFHQQYCGYVH